MSYEISQEIYLEKQLLNQRTRQFISHNSYLISHI